MQGSDISNREIKFHKYLYQKIMQIKNIMHIEKYETH